MKAILVAALLAIPATALAKPVFAPPPPPPAPPALTPMPCPASGAVLFEIRKRSEVKAPTSTTRIYTNGAWTFQPIDAEGNHGRLVRGCFDKPTLREIRGALRAAPWDITYSRIMCFAYSPDFTVYMVRGRKMFTARMCGTERVDDETMASIQMIEKRLADAMPKPMPKPLPRPIVRRHHTPPPIVFGMR